MSFLAAIVSAVVTPAASAAPSVVPSVTPSASPSLAPLAHAATTASPGLWDALNTVAGHVSTSDALLVAGALVVLLQAGLNKLPFLKSEIAKVQDVVRHLVSVVLPFVGALVASLATGQNDLHLAPAVYLVGQVIFYAVKLLRGQSPVVASSATASPETVQY